MGRGSQHEASESDSESGHISHIPRDKNHGVQVIIPAKEMLEGDWADFSMLGSKCFESERAGRNAWYDTWRYLEIFRDLSQSMSVVR